MLTDYKFLFLVSILPFLVVFRRIRQVKQAWQVFGDLPAYFIFVSPVSIFSRLLPRIPRISPGADFNWENAYERQPLLTVQSPYPAQGPCLDIFAASKSDIVQLRSLFPNYVPQLLLADATAAKVDLISLSGGNHAQCLNLGHFSEPYSIPQGLSANKIRPEVRVRSKHPHERTRRVEKAPENCRTKLHRDQ